MSAVRPVNRGVGVRAASYDWTTERDAALTRLWAEGVSSYKIAAQLAAAQRSVLTRALVLGLPSRVYANKTTRTVLFRWSDAADAELRRLWAEGRTGQQIADVMGCRRQGALARARYLALPNRAAGFQKGNKASVKGGAAPRQQRQKLARPPAPTPLPVIVTPIATAEDRAATRAYLAARPAKACCWPSGDPKRQGFRFCDAAVEPERPYCPTHCAAAYELPARRAA